MAVQEEDVDEDQLAFFWPKVCELMGDGGLIVTMDPELHLYVIAQLMYKTKWSIGTTLGLFMHKETK